MYTYIMHRVHICIYIYMCVYHSHFDRRSLRIFNTHMCKYVLTLIICLLLLVYFTCIRTYTYALTLIAAHCSVSSSCLQVACSYCTASGFTFRPVCRAHAWTFVSPEIWENKKKRGTKRTKKKTKQASARGWVELALTRAVHSRFRDHNRVLQAFPACLVQLDRCSQNRSDSRERRKGFPVLCSAIQARLRYGMHMRDRGTAIGNSRSKLLTWHFGQEPRKIRRSINLRQRKGSDQLGDPITIRSKDLGIRGCVQILKDIKIPEWQNSKIFIKGL